MAVRRPRIKASANLMNSKRKPKVKSTEKIQKCNENAVDIHRQMLFAEEEEVPSVETENAETGGKKGFQSDMVDNRNQLLPVSHLETQDKKLAQQSSHEQKGNILLEEQLNTELKISTSTTDQTDESETEATLIPTNKQKPYDDHMAVKMLRLQTMINKSNEAPFKCPPNVSGYNRTHSYSSGSGCGINNNEDAIQSDLEENVIQMDLIKSNISGSMSPLSPSKAFGRQRIRATPIFGQRRNSFVGTSSSPSPHTGDDSASEFTAPTQHRRERHFSASHSTSVTSAHPFGHYYHTPHKYVPSMGRIRTESGCSAFSDSYAGSIKSRKNDEQHRALSRRDFEARFKNGVVSDKSMLKMFDLIYYNPDTNPMEQKPDTAKIKQESTNCDESKSSSSPSISNDDKKTATTNNNKNDTEVEQSSSIPVPQLKLNANGELILDDKSLEIETTAEQEARKALANSSLIFLDENTGMNGFYRKQKRTKDWLPVDTIKFYRCLQIIGTDFSLMGQLFPERTRRDLKLKFKKEERINLALINKALMHPKMFNIEELRKQLEIEDRERGESERKWKQIMAKESKKLKKAHRKLDTNASAAARALTDGDTVYQNENVTRVKKRSKTKTNLQQSRQIAANTTSLPQETINIKVDEIIVESSTAKRKCKDGVRPKHVDIDDICNSADNDVSIPKSDIKRELNYSKVLLHNNASIEVENNQLEEELTDLLQQSDHALDATTFLNNTNNENIDNCTTIKVLKTDQNFIESDAFASRNNNNNMHIKKVEKSDVCDMATDSSDVMDEGDIQKILTELAEGSMILVSTLDPNDADKELNEIYMFDKNTGEFSETPLAIPDEIVQCIMTVMS